MSGATLVSSVRFKDSPTGPLPSSVQLSSCLRLPILFALMIRNPIPKYGLGSFPFARRYSENRCFFLFLRLLRCFSSPGYLLTSYLIQMRIHTHYCMWVSPFGNLRFYGYVRLPAAYRSLSRPSSAPVARASTLCSCSLNLLMSDLSIVVISWFFEILLHIHSSQFLRLILYAFSFLEIVVNYLQSVLSFVIFQTSSI